LCGPWVDAVAGALPRRTDVLRDVARRICEKDPKLQAAFEKWARSSSGRS
jgi:hypothetical protein